MTVDWAHILEVGIGAIVMFAVAWGTFRNRVGRLEKDQEKDMQERAKDADECRKGIAGLQATLGTMNTTLVGLNSMVNTLMPERLRQVEDLREEMREEIKISRQGSHKLRESLQRVLVDLSERLARLEGNSGRHARVDLSVEEDT